jgi:predicted transcriptional regulator
MESRQVSGKQSIHYRNYRRARDRALVRLSHLYADEYKQLLVEERELDELEGKKWIGVVDNTRLTITTHTRANSVPAFTGGDTSNAGQNQGNNGGEA